jgi:ABC-type antimicrobial peptide transport system permease subunit
MLTDLRHAWRGVWRSPIASVATALTLALALGIGTAVMSLFDRLLLTPPPIADVDSVFILGERPTADVSAAPRPVRVDTLRSWQTHDAHAWQLEAYDPTNVTLTGADDPVRISATAITPGFLTLVGVTPQLGRAFTGDDTGVAIVSDEFARTRLNRSPALLGATLTLNGQPHTVVGVLPPGFDFPLSPTAIWVPLPLSDANTRVRVLARVTQGVSADALLSQLDAGTTSRGTSAAAVPLRTMLDGVVSTALPLLLAAAALGLVLTAVNVSSLLLLRSMQRARDFATRAAIGASRHQLARHAWLETLLVTGVGSAAAVVIAVWATPALGRLAASQLALSVDDFSVSGRTLAASCVSALAIALLAARTRRVRPA